MTDLRLADIIRDFEQLQVARREAFALVEDDPELGRYPALREEVQALLGEAVERLFTDARA